MSQFSERAKKSFQSLWPADRADRTGLRPKPGPTLYSLFEEQACLNPAQLAASSAHHSFTYGELSVFARRVGQAILQEPPPPGVPVALLFAHDALVAGAQLGVYAAGRICVPLDPDQPEARLEMILGHTEAKLILCDKQHLSAALRLAGTHVRCKCIEDESTLPRSTDPFTPTAPEETACIIFTSGSTGRPKGVCQSHRTIIHDVLAMSRLHRLDSDDRIAVLAPASTIAGITALFGALLSGASAHYFDVRANRLTELAAWLDRERITFYQSVATLFRRLLTDTAEPSRFEHIRVVRLVGEPVTQTEWRLWRNRFPKNGIFETGLGSSEACMVSRWIADRNTRWEGAVLPAGRALPDKEIIMADESGCAVASGTAGEILVRSEYLFEGYWQNPELTAAVLTHGNADSSRLLHTGDIGRLLPDGTLLHLGRRDGQVKVSGNRVEIAEVETALRELDTVRDAAVITLEAATGGNHLVAYVVAAKHASTHEQELLARLRELLPSYMVPDNITIVPDLPLLPGGKIDRVALAAHAQESGEAVLDFAPPESPVEETLTSIFENVLNLTRVGRKQHLFLDLGADSLAAVQIAGKVSEVFGWQIPPEVLGDCPTVAALSGLLAAEDKQTRDHLLLNPQGNRAPLFTFCGAFGSALRLLAIALRLDENQPFVGLQPPGMDWAGVEAHTLDAMIEHYHRELLRLADHGPYRLLGTSFGGIFAFEIACRLRTQGATVELLAMVDSYPPDCMVGGRFDRAERRDWTLGAPTDSPLAAAGVRVARQHRAAFDRYRLTHRFDGTILYFRCSDPPPPDFQDRRMLWKHFASDMKIVDVPGVHGQFHEEPQLSAILKSLRTALQPQETKG